MCESTTYVPFPRFSDGPIPGYVCVQPNQTVIQDTWKEQGEGIIAFESREGDSWVMAHPRSGSFIVQNIVWILQNDLIRTVDDEVVIHEAAWKYLFEQCFFHFEVSLCKMTWKSQRQLTYRDPKTNTFDEIDCDMSKYSYDVFRKLDNKLGNEKDKVQRFFRSYLPLSMHHPNILNSGAKVIYVARHPLDRIACFHRFLYQSTPQMLTDDIQTYWKSIKENKTFLAPILDHILQAHRVREHKNVLFLLYEDIIMDIEGKIKEIADFLGKSLTDNEVKKLAEYVNPENLEQIKNLNNIQDVTGSKVVHKMNIGGHKEYVQDKGIIEDIKEWMETNLQDDPVLLQKFRKLEETW